MRECKLLRNSIFAVFIIIMDKKNAPNVGVQMLSVRASGGGHSIGFARIVTLFYKSSETRLSLSF